MTPGRPMVAAVVGLAILLVACGGTPETAEPSPRGTRRTETPAEETPAEETATIPGAISGDFKTNLEGTWGLQWTGPQEGATGTYFDEGETIDPDTGARLSASIHGDGPSAIAFFECSVDGGSTDLAGSYLGFCATVPYDGAAPDAARAWVRDNVSAVQPGTPIEETFGGIRFILSGNASAGLIVLEISAL
ncbi:MAG: hypothetical protein ACRDHO_01425 [Actinomycetota bacterium]